MGRNGLLWLLTPLFLMFPGCASQKALPASPPLGTVHLPEPGVMEYEVVIPRGGAAEHVWVYLPANPAQAKVPCVFIAPAGTRLFHGNDLDDSGRPEHFPYVRAGFAVVAYSLDGPLEDKPTDHQVVEATRAFKDADAGLLDERAAVDYALAKVPQIDPKRLYAAGHSSAGTLSLLVAENDPRIAACVAYAPCCNVPKRLGLPLLRALDDAVPGEQDFLARRSPNVDVAKLTCPLFLFHADDDSVVPAADVDEFAGMVQRTNAHTTYVRVPTGDHYDSMIQQGVPQAIRWLQALPAKS